MLPDSRFGYWKDANCSPHLMVYLAAILCRQSGVASSWSILFDHNTMHAVLQPLLRKLEYLARIDPEATRWKTRLAPY